MMKRPVRPPEDQRDDDAFVTAGRRWTAVLPAVVLSAAFAMGTAQAQSISVSSDPSVIVVDTAVPGSAPDAVMETSTTYAVSTDSTATVLARLSQTVPSGVTLAVELEAPPGAVSHGFVQLTTLDREVVTEIDPGSYSNLEITYRLSATADAGTVPLTGRDVVLTVLHN